MICDQRKGDRCYLAFLLIDVGSLNILPVWNQTNQGGANTPSAPSSANADECEPKLKTVQMLLTLVVRQSLCVGLSGFTGAAELCFGLNRWRSWGFYVCAWIDFWVVRSCLFLRALNLFLCIAAPGGPIVALPSFVLNLFKKLWRINYFS